ncbi:MAG: SWIM zinc finger family protein, partial [Blastocatellia bacterium]|nr:SWIM zinc finger family protein [Blastocatellia bacterium]
MAINWTKDQVIALSPDASSTKAGQGLTNKSKWETLGYDELFAWGECKGSGKDPYKVQINLSEPAFKCSCPSHKFPCKHCLGLFLMLISQESSFTEKEQPLWVKEWIESRTKKAEKQSKKVEKQTTEPKKAPDPEKQAARAAEREAKVKAGIQELELWLKDLIRQGLSITQSQKYSFWDTPAARMVDAQAPGLARMLREMANIPTSGAAWQERLLEKLSLLHLIIEGYKNIENLPLANQQDIRSLIGWTQNQEELLNQPGIFDNWLILGQRVESDSLTPTLRSQRIWLKGQQTKQFALILNFVFGN